MALVATFAMTFGTYGMLLVNSLAFQGLRGVSALATAVAFLPMPLVYLALIPVVNVIARRTGPRPPMISGLVLMGAGMLLYAAVGPQADLGLLEPAFVLAGAGLAFNTGPAVSLAMAAAPVARAGLASGVVNLARLVGITVGVAVMGTVLAWVGGGAGAGSVTGSAIASGRGQRCSSAAWPNFLRPLSWHWGTPVPRGHRVPRRRRRPAVRDVAELPVTGDADIAALAALLADPARCKVLLALDDGRALPASVLADEAGVSRSTASSHLGKLTDAGLLTVRTHGRHRYYRLAGPDVADLLERLGRMAPQRPVRSLREGTRAARLRSARTCYDHFAGRLGVAIMGSLLERDASSAATAAMTRGATPTTPRAAKDTTSPTNSPIPGTCSSPTRVSKYLAAEGRWWATASTGPNSGTTCPAGWVAACLTASCRRLGQAVQPRAGGHGHRPWPYRARRLFRHRLDGLIHRIAAPMAMWHSKPRSIAMARYRSR